MKKGPPATAVIRPSGTSAGGSTLRAIASATVTTSAPASALAGSTQRWRGPTHQRAICGAARPTKATSPP
ncbi:hypothetical protein D3C80_2196000 [compost metagenome]